MMTPLIGFGIAFIVYFIVGISFNKRSNILSSPKYITDKHGDYVTDKDGLLKKEPKTPDDLQKMETWENLTRNYWMIVGIVLLSSFMFFGILLNV